MTPQEIKAREIVINMQYQKEPLKFEQAKHCALTAVDTVLSLMVKFHNRQIENNISEIIYWKEVKQEIEKL